MAHAEEKAYAKVATGDFEDNTQKWAVVSMKGVCLPMDPEAGEESMVTVALTILVENVLPGDWDDFVENVAEAFDRGSERWALGVETSDHTGGDFVQTDTTVPEGSPNTTVSATAYQYAMFSVTGLSSNGHGWPWDDEDHGAKAETSAETIVGNFEIEKN